jgi:hypothetical protein
MRTFRESSSAADPGTRTPRMDCRIKSGNDDLKIRSRDTLPCPRSAYHNDAISKKGSPPATKGRRSAERRMPPCAARHPQALPLVDVRARLRASQTSVRSLRTHLLSGRARLPALLPRFSPETLTSPTQLQAMLPGTWHQAGVTCPLLSQSSDSTSRLGRSTEGPDARSRSGGACEAGRKHRTRPTLRIASGMRPSLSEILFL